MYHTRSLNKFRETNIYSYALAYPTFDLHSLFLSYVSKNKLCTYGAAHPLGGRHYLLTPLFLYIISAETFASKKPIKELGLLFLYMW